LEADGGILYFQNQGTDVLDELYESDDGEPLHIYWLTGSESDESFSRSGFDAPALPDTNQGQEIPLGRIQEIVLRSPVERDIDDGNTILMDLTGT
jgi:hypothetical protein